MEATKNAKANLHEYYRGVILSKPAGEPNRYLVDLRISPNEIAIENKDLLDKKQVITTANTDPAYREWLFRGQRALLKGDSEITVTASIGTGATVLTSDGSIVPGYRGPNAPGLNCSIASSVGGVIIPIEIILRKPQRSLMRTTLRETEQAFVYWLNGRLHVIIYNFANAGTEENAAYLDTVARGSDILARTKLGGVPYSIEREGTAYIGRLPNAPKVVEDGNVYTGALVALEPQTGLGDASMITVYPNIWKHDAAPADIQPSMKWGVADLEAMGGDIATGSVSEKTVSLNRNQLRIYASNAQTMVFASGRLIWDKGDFNEFANTEFVNEGVKGSMRNAILSGRSPGITAVPFHFIFGKYNTVETPAGSFQITPKSAVAKTYTDLWSEGIRSAERKGDDGRKIANDLQPLLDVIR